MNRWNRKRTKTVDKTTRKLMDAGVLTVERRQALSRRGGLGRRSPYGFWSAVRYTFGLSLLLWWMPTFGQMIAGYVGGRRAGGPWRGAFAAFIPVAIFVAVIAMANHGIFTNEISYIATLPSYIGSGISAHFPVLAPYIDFATIYVATFVATLSSTLHLGLNGFLVTVIFAYIGGIVSYQRRKEIEFVSAGIPATVSTSPHRAVFSSSSSSRPVGWYAIHPESLSSLKKIPVASAYRARDSQKISQTSSKQSKSSKTKRKEQKKRTASKDQEKIGKKLAERALRNYR